MKTVTKFFSPLMLFSLFSVFCVPLTVHAMQQNNNNNNNNQALSALLRKVVKNPALQLAGVLTDEQIQIEQITEALRSVLKQNEFPRLLALLFTKSAELQGAPERIKHILEAHPKYLPCIDFRKIATTLDLKQLHDLQASDIVNVINKQQLAQAFECTVAEIEPKIQSIAQVVINTLNKKPQDAFVSVLKYEDFPRLLATSLSTLANAQLLPELTKSLLACHTRYLPCINFKQIATILEKSSFDNLQEQDIIAVINQAALAEFFNCSIAQLRQKIDLPATARIVIKALQKEYDTIDPEDIVKVIDSSQNAANRIALEITLTYAFRMIKKAEKLPVFHANSTYSSQEFDLIAKALGYLDTRKAQALFTKITNRERVTAQELQDMLKPEIQAFITQRHWINFDKLAELLHDLMFQRALSSQVLQEAFNTQNIQRDTIIAKIFGSLSQAPEHMATLINKVFSDELDRTKLEEALKNALIHQQELTAADLQALLKPEWKALAQKHNFKTVIKDTQAFVALINKLLKAETLSQEQLQAAFDMPAIEKLLDLQPGTLEHALDPQISAQEDQKTLTLFKRLLSGRANTALTMASGAALATSAALMYQALCGNQESFCHNTAPTGFVAGALAGTLGLPALGWCYTALTKPVPMVNLAASCLVNKAKKIFIQPKTAQVAPVVQLAQPEQSTSSSVPQVYTQTSSHSDCDSDRENEREPEQVLTRRPIRTQQQQPAAAQASSLPSSHISSTEDRPPSTSQQQQSPEQSTTGTSNTIQDTRQDTAWDLMSDYYQELIASITPEQRVLVGNTVQERATILHNAQTNPALLTKNSAFVHALTTNQLEILANLMGTQDYLMSLPDIPAIIKNRWRTHFTVHEGLLELINNLDQAGTHDARYRLLQRPHILALSVYNPQLLLKETNFLRSLNPALQNSITNNNQ